MPGSTHKRTGSRIPGKAQVHRCSGHNPRFFCIPRPRTGARVRIIEIERSADYILIIPGQVTDLANHVPVQPVDCHVDNDGSIYREVDILGDNYQIPKRPVMITPQERFATIDKENRGSPVIKNLHIASYLFVGIVSLYDVVDTAVSAMEIAAIGDCYGSDQRPI